MKTIDLGKITEEPDVLISTKERPIWQKILAAICFALSAWFLYLPFQFIGFFPSNMIRLFGSAIGPALLISTLGIHFAMVKEYYFDLKNRQYKIVKRIGPIEIGKWKDFQNLNYISVFKNGKGILQVNLWYNKNKHFNLGITEDLSLALIVGRKIDEKLEIDLWDAATDPHDAKWVPIEN